MTERKKRPSLLRKYKPSSRDRRRTAYDEVTDEVLRPPFVNFVFKRGLSKALPYTGIIWMGCNVSTQIKIIFASHTVTIRGTHLEPMFAGLLAQRISEFREGDDRHDTERDERLPFITSIDERQRSSDKEDHETLYQLEE